MNFIGIKLSENKFTANCAKVVRKYRNIPISEIKRLVAENDYLYKCDCVDSAGVENILSLHNDLCAEKIDSTIYEDDKVISIDIINNMLASFEIVRLQVEEDINNEALAEEGD